MLPGLAGHILAHVGLPTLPVDWLVPEGGGGSRGPMPRWTERCAAPCTVGMVHETEVTKASTTTQESPPGWPKSCHLIPGKSYIRPPPPSPHIRPEGIFQGRGVGVYILRPHAAGILYAPPPPPFIHPPTPRRVFSGGGGVGVYKIWPRTYAQGNQRKIHQQAGTGNRGTWQRFSLWARGVENRKFPKVRRIVKPLPVLPFPCFFGFPCFFPIARYSLFFWAFFPFFPGILGVR